MALATPTITWVDNAAGTGGTITVAGATALTTNTIMAARWDGGFTSVAWASQGSRSGNGTVAAAVADGYWFFYCLSALAGEISVISNIIGGVATSGADSISKQVMDAVVTRLQAMTFSGLVGSSIVVRKFPISRNLTKPCILVAPVPERVDPAGGTNERDEILYGVFIGAMQASNQDPTSDHNRILLWRQQIRLALMNHRLTGIASLTGQQYPEMGPPIAQPIWAQGWDVSALTLRVGSRETRGLT